MTTFLSITGNWIFTILIIIAASIIWIYWHKKSKTDRKYNITWKLSIIEFTIFFILWHLSPYLDISGPSLLRSLLTMIVITHILIISTICWAKKIQEGKYMLCSWALLGSAVFYARLAEIMVLPFSEQVENIVLIGLILEASILAFAIAYRFRMIEIEKQKAQQQAILNLKEADKMKDEFLAKISHEFRTPLHGILGICESLLDSIKNKSYEKILSGVNLVESCSRRLLHLINDILDVSLIHKKGIILHSKPLNLRTILENTIAIYQPLAQQKNLTYPSISLPNYQILLQIRIVYNKSWIIY